MRILAWAWVLIGCGGGSGNGIDVFAPGAALVVVQDGDGAPQELALDADGHGNFAAPSGFYTITRVCPLIGNVRAPAATRYDTVGEVELPCGVGSLSTRLTGTTAPDAEVWVDSSPVNPDDNGVYTAFALPARRDVFAVIHAPPVRLFAARDIDLTTDRVLDLPVATEGIELATVTPNVDVAAAAVSFYTDINTANGGYVFLGSSSPSVAVPPASALLPGDRATIGAQSGNCTVQQALTAATPTFSIPAPLDADLARREITWSADPAVEWELVRLLLFDAVSNEVLFAFASTSWLEASGRLDSLPVVDIETLPGFTPELGGFEPGANLNASFGIVRGTFDGDLTSCDVNTTLIW
jgi:hypothetical protein